MSINYKPLPDLINSGLVVFTSTEEQKVFVASAITTISAGFSRVSGLYDGENIRPNLYTFIVGKAASGKSAMKYGKQYGEKIHQCLVKNTLSVVSIKSKVKSKPHNLFFLPGNTSAAAFIKTIGVNPKGVLVVETEADTLAQVLGKEYGGFSDDLRKAYHHESISYLRATDNEYIEVEKPKLSLLLSGTPMQVPGLMPNVEDGLFSRFSFVMVNGKDEFKDPFKSKIDKAAVIAPLADRFKAIYDQALADDFTFKLTDKQQEKLVATGERWLKIAKGYGSNGASLAYRGGLKIFKTAMTLAAVKHFEDGKKGKVIMCSDELFDWTCNYCEDNFYDTLELYTICGKSKTTSKLSPKELQVFDLLDDSYELPKDLNTASKIAGISDRMGRNYQNKYVSLKLVKPDKGKEYIKVK